MRLYLNEKALPSSFICTVKKSQRNQDKHTFNWLVLPLPQLFDLGETMLALHNWEVKIKDTEAPPSIWVL